MLLGKERGEFLSRRIGTGKKVLDIGCRDGALTAAYAKGNEVLGLDIDLDALNRAHATLGISTLHTDLNGEWGVPLKTYDVVVAAEIVEHLYYPQLVIGKMVDVLKDEGMVLITVPNAYSLKNRFRYLLKKKRGTPLDDPTHINHFTVKELHDFLVARFERVELEGKGRYRLLAKWLPQAFAFDLCFAAYNPKKDLVKK